MAQPPVTTRRYGLATEDPDQYGLNQQAIDRERLRSERAIREEAERKKRQAELDKHLSKYEDDPVSRTLATMRFRMDEEKAQAEAQKVARQKERDSIIKKYDDPVLQAQALVRNDIEKSKNVEQKQAFADREALQKIKERDKTSRKLDRVGLGNAALRESIGAIVNTVPDLAAPIARAGEAVGLIPEKAADELHRQSQDFGQARQQSREDDMSPWLSRMYGGAAQSLIQMGATPGGAGAKILGAGVMAGDQALTTATDVGLEGTDRLRYALTQGGLEAGLAWLGQKLFGAGIESRLAGQGARATTWLGLAKNIVKDAAKEAPEEGATSGLQDLSSYLEGISPDMTWGEAVTNIGEAAVQAAMMAPMTNARNAGRLLFGSRKPQEPPQNPEFAPEPNLIDSTRQPVFPGEQSPDEDAVPQDTLDRMMDAANARKKAKEDFANNPTRKTYDAALKAGLDPAKPDKTTPDGTPFLSDAGRKKYAAEKLVELLGMRKPDPRTDTSPNVPPASKPATVPEDVSQQFFNEFETLLKKGDQNAQTETKPQKPQKPEAAQGQTEGVLTDDSDRAAFEQEYRNTFADWQKHPRESEEFRNADAKMQAMDNAQPDWAQEIEDSDPNWTKTWLQKMRPQTANEPEASPDDPAKGFVRVYHSGSAGDGNSQRWVSTSKEYGSNYRPDSPLFYTDIPEDDPRIQGDYENQGLKQGFTFNFELTPKEVKGLRRIDREASPGATGGPSPDQSPESAGPVSKPELLEHQIIEKGDDGLYYPSTKMRPGKLPSSSFKGFKTEQEAADWFKPRTKPPGPIPHPDPMKGSIGYNNHGLPIYESKTGLRTVGGETEQAARLKDVKGQMQAVLAGPRQDKFKTDQELDVEKAKPVSKQPWEMTRDEFVKIPLGFQLNTESEAFQQLDKKRQSELLKQQAEKDTKDRAINELVGEDLSRPPSDSTAAHRHVVEKALAAGKPVPAEVLADYPELASATEHDRLYKELQPLYRDPKHKAGDREHMERIRDLEQQVEFHKPAAVARAQAEIDAEAAKKPPAAKPEPSIEDLNSGKALKDRLKSKVDEWIATGTNNGKRALDTRWEAGAVKRLVDSEFGVLTKGKHGGSLAAAKIAVSKARTFAELHSALDKITPEPSKELAKAETPPEASKQAVEYPEKGPVIEDWFGPDKARVLEWTKTLTPGKLQRKDYAAVYRDGKRIAAGLVEMASGNMIDILADGKIQRFFQGDKGNKFAVGIARQRKPEKPAFEPGKPPETLDELLEQFQTSTSAIDKTKAAALGVLVRGVAKYRGMSPDEYVKQRFAGVVSGGTPAEGALFSRASSRLAARLESGKKVKVYRAMQLIDGKLYPPMAAKVDGKMVDPTEIGTWEVADERPDLVRGGKFKLDKANGTSLTARYNPYFHTSRSPLNDQFSSAHKRDNLVTVEVEVPESELTSGYKAEGAKDAVGEMSWNAGPVSSKLPPSKTRKVILSRYAKVTRIVPDSEVASVIAQMLKGEGIRVPANVVTPSLRSELEKRGVNIAEVFNQTRAGIVRASVEFNKDARALIRALNSTNIADMVHELGHIFRRDLSASDMAAVEKWAGVINGKWTEAAEELWATGFERYLAEGKAPTSSMKGVFAQFKEWLADIYGAIIGSDIDVNVSDEVKEIMERLVSGPKPEKTLSGQKILPGMTGRAEEIDRSEFVRKHQTVLLDDMRELVDDEEMIDALREPSGNILKAVWNGDLKETQDLYDTDLGDRLWTALTAMIAYHAPAKREAGLESIADEAIRRAFTHRDSIKPKVAEKSAEPTESDFKAGVRAEIARQLAEEAAAAEAKVLSWINIGDKVEVISTGEKGQVQTVMKNRGALVGIEGAPGSRWIPLADLKPSSYKDAIDQLVDQVSGKPAKTPRKPRTPKADTTPKPPRTKIGEKLGELSEDTGAAAKQEFEKWLKGVKGMPLNSALGPFNKDLAKMTVTMVRAQVKDKVVKFADLVERIVAWSSPDLARNLSDYIEAAWDILRETNPKLDPAGKVADVLKEKGETNEDGRVEGSEESRDESMGGMPVESEGELAPKTGGTSTGGNAEDVSGSDSGSLSGRTDSTEGSESDAAGEFTEGNDSGTDAGEKPKPGRKPSVRGGRKPTGGIQGKVEPTNNLRIQPGDTIAPKGEVGKLNANIAAIKLLKTLTAENRPATDDEKRVLMQYTGWGSLQHAFDEFRGEAYIARPGLAEPFGADYKKTQLYASKKKGEYLSPEELQNRAEAWESKWGESYKYLKENLTKDEWKKAYASVANAHFTSRDVITHGIWGALKQMGVTGGRFMESSSGIGSLIGLMPDTIANNSEVLAIELDSLTGEMVRKLYPDADVHVKGFEEVPIPPGTIDIAATNVPFHQSGPLDAETRYGRPMNLHNYFIARILDSLRPGGIAAVISTHFTMDANPQDRALLASKADLVGAIRLPNNAFKANAGTEVTTDIMFFRKPDGSPFKSEAWQNMVSVGTHDVPVKNKKGVRTGTKTVPMVANEYFDNHPEMVLGTHSMAGKMRAAEDSGEEYTLLPIPDAVLADQLKAAVAHLPDGIATTDNAPLMPSLDTSTSGVDGRVEFRNGKLQEWSNKEWVAPLWIKDHIDLRKDGKPRKDVKPATRNAKLANAMTRAIAYTKVRNAYESHIQKMRTPETTDAEYEASQKSLNDNYDAYRKAHGPINDTESEFLERDPGFFQIAGLEIEAEKRVAGKRVKSYAKADVFRERTLNADAVPEKADSTEEAVKISLAWRGSINLPWMSALTGTPESDLRTELLASGAVFENPATGMLEPADTYLAGNVQAKLRAAEQAVKDGNSAISKNVEFLKQVQPPRASVDSITPSLGENWIGAELTQQWVHEVMGLKDAIVKYNEKADIWGVSGYTYGAPQDIQNDWGGLKSPVVSLLNKVLNGASTQVMKKVGTGKLDKKGNEIEVSVVDEAQTQAAQNKAEKMRASFLKWAKTDESVIPKLEQAFNEQKNFYVKPIWNGEHLTFPGMSEEWVKQIRPYQKNTIWRGIREGRGMIAHGVGAGKTAEIIAIAMEMKRLGTATKPMIVVQNSTLGQFARTFNQIYPTAKVLVATSEDLSERNRAKFMARVATGNWDSIVMAKSTFNEKLPNDPVREQQMMEGLIDELKDILLENALADGAGSPSVKAIQQQITSLEKRLKKIIERSHARQDTDVFFEQMGVDALFLDEAHDYKKPPFVTKLDKKIKGITNEVSGRALNALIKMRFVQDNNKGRNTFMATGTPITNTLGEAWLLMNMVAPDVTKEFGVSTFDRFVGMFATVSVTQEQDPVGKLRRVTRLAKFKNGRQLGQFISAGWDVLLGADLHDKIREYGGGKIPTIKGGKDQLYLVDRSPAFNRFAAFFNEVYDAFKNLEGKDKRIYSWVPVTIYGAAQAAAIDIRLVDPTAPDDPGSKLNKMVAGVAEAYREGNDQKLTQLIFSDLSGRRSMEKLKDFADGTGVELEVEEVQYDEDGNEIEPPEVDTSKEDRWLYQEIKRKLVEQGIPESEVQIINDYVNPKKPELLLEFMERVNTGEVRIVIGHSDTLGTGVNVQERLWQIWHLDIPMVPAKKQQRDGRGIRSGNMNDEIVINMMAMQKSLDTALMDMNVRKAKAAEQALSGKAGNEFDDPFSANLMSMQDMQAAMNDDPYFYRKSDLEFKIRNLLLDKEALDQQKSQERFRLRVNEESINASVGYIKDEIASADKIADVVKSNPPITVEGKVVKNAKEAEAALKQQFKEQSERISELTQAGTIPALGQYANPKSEHIAAEVEFGPVQFTLYYGERPEVKQDDNGDPFTEWTSSSGTIATTGGKKIFDKNITSFPTIMKTYVDDEALYRRRAKDRSDEAERKTAENEKLREFLAKPYESQNELDNLQSELAQINALMYARDNPAPHVPPATPETPPPAADAPVESDLRSAAGKDAFFIQNQKKKNAGYYQDFRNQWNRFTRGSTPGSGAAITPEMLRTFSNIVVGEAVIGAKRFSVLIKKLRREFDDAIVNHMKPYVIVMWNANQGKYGLDEATPELFDDAMSDTVNVDVEKTIEAAQAVQLAEEPQTEPSDGDKEFSTQNAFSAVAREELNMQERPKVEKQSREPSIEAAEAYGKTTAGSKFIDELVAELTTAPRAVTPWENDLLNYRHAELYNNLLGSLRKQTSSARAGDDAQEAVGQREARGFTKLMQDLVEFVLEPIGTAAGRALQARKAIINRTYTIVRLALEFEAAHGRAPDTEGHTGELAAMQKQIDDLDAKIAELEKSLAESEAKNNEYAELLKAAHDDLVNKAATTEAPPEAPEAPEPATKTPKTPSAEKTRKEKVLEKIHRAGDKFRSLLKAERLNSVGGALGTFAEAALEMAEGYSELGVVTLGEFLKRASRTIGKEAKRFFPELKAAWKQVRAGVSGPVDISSITDKIDIDVPDTVGRAARALHAFVIERDGLDASAEGRGAAVVAVHEILADFVEGITEDETARAMSGIGIFSELSDEKIEVIRRDQKAQLLLLEQLKAWELARLAELKEKGTGVPPLQTGQQHGEKSPEQREIQKRVNEAKKASGVETTSAGMLRSAFAAAMRQVSNRINDLDKAIRTKTPITRSKTVLPDPTGELKKKQDERDALQKLYDAAFPRPELTEEQRKIAVEKALDRAIAGMDADNKAGKLWPDDPNAPVTSPAIDAKRAALDALKAVRDELRISSGEAEQRSNAAYERILKERDAKLAKRIADKDFKPRPKKPARVLTPSQLVMMRDIAEKKLVIDKQSKEWIFKKRHIVYKVWKKGPVAVAHTLRKLKTGFDESYIGRQGWLLGLTHWNAYGKAIRKGFASNPVEARSIFPTPQDVFNAEAELDADANWVLMEKTGKLAVTGVHGGMARTEEGNNFVPDWVDDIWGVGGSERAAAAFINTLRRTVFRELVNDLATMIDGKRSISAAELRVIGNIVNGASGRGSIGKYTNALEAWTTVFFSPRWWASRLNWWTLQPLWHDAKWTGGEGASTEVRILAAKEWAKQAVAQFTMMGLAVAGLTAAFGPPGEDEEWDWYWDPRSPKFGNIRIGHSYFDMTAGLAQHLSVFWRLFLSDTQVNRWDTEEVDKVRLLMNYGRGKLAPVPSMGWDYLAGKSIGQHKFGSQEWFSSQVEPLISQDIRKAFRNEDIPLASVLSTWMILGGTAQSWEARTKSRNDVANELRVMKKANKSPEKIQKTLNAHLKEAAAAEAKTALRTAKPEERAALQKVIDGVESPELTEAIEKERQDIILNASSRVSADNRRAGEEKEFSGSEDKGRMTTRMLVPMMVPDVKTALNLYNEAYRAKNKSTTEIVRGERVPKAAVSNGHARIRKLYQK